mgnify:CR=1 FL=1
MKNILSLIVMVLLTVVFCATAAAQGLSSTALINQAKEYDGKTVTYAGELIGEIMRRGEFAWVNISDGEHSIGVWINAALLKDINFTGNFKTRGDTVEVTGVFYRACPEHGGDLDIHAQGLRKLASGRMVGEKLNSDKLTLIIVLLVALPCIWILTLFKHK